MIQSALLNTGNLPPCISSVPTFKIGGVSTGAVAYAGFVADTVAGLYQLNVPLPSTTGTFYPNYPLTNNPITNITAPVQLPLQITLNGVSQPGVTIWVTPRLKVTDPLGNTTQNPLDLISTTVGVSYSGTVTATETANGTTYSYAVTSGLLPTGLALNGTTGVISGKPAANTAGSYTITVTATDNAHVPVKGSVTFTISCRRRVVPDLFERRTAVPHHLPERRGQCHYSHGDRRHLSLHLPDAGLLSLGDSAGHGAEQHHGCHFDDGSYRSGELHRDCHRGRQRRSRCNGNPHFRHRRCARNVQESQRLRKLPARVLPS